MILGMLYNVQGCGHFSTRQTHVSDAALLVGVDTVLRCSP